ncbi:MAG: hypothetical protein HOW97_38910 [Catenulispora sp.]|nr:hypothetical protein [Catenulispora sp.]
MYIVHLTYIAPLEQIDALIPEHAAWLDEHYATGAFLLSGRREPRTGGVILTAAMPRADLDAILAGDPFGRAGVAEYEVVEFLPGKTAPELAAHRITS